MNINWRTDVLTSLFYSYYRFPGVCEKTTVVSGDVIKIIVDLRLIPCFWEEYRVSMIPLTERDLVLSDCDSCTKCWGCYALQESPYQEHTYSVDFLIMQKVINKWHLVNNLLAEVQWSKFIFLIHTLIFCKISVKLLFDFRGFIRIICEDILHDIVMYSHHRVIGFNWDNFAISIWLTITDITHIWTYLLCVHILSSVTKIINYSRSHTNFGAR